MRRQKIIAGLGLYLLMSTVAVLGTAISVRSATAECTPGQMQEADLAYSSAYQFITARAWDQAVPRLVSTLEMCPEHVNSLRALARAYREVGRWEDAKATYEQLLEVAPEATQAGDYAGLGVVLTKLQDYTQARAQYVKASALAPEDCSILFNLGVLHMAVQDYRRAVEALERTLLLCESVKDRVIPKLADACEKAAAKEDKIGNADKAKMYRDKRAQYAGQTSSSEGYDLVKQFMRERKFAEAVPLLQGMLKSAPDRVAYLLSLARCQDALGRKSEAISAYERYLTVEPDDEKSTAVLIRTYSEAGNCQQGIALARTAKARFEPKGRAYLAAIYYSWGMALECSKNYADAREMFRQCLNCNHSEWNEPARQQIQRQQDLIEFEEAKRRQAEQGR